MPFKTHMQVKGMAEKLGVQINWLGRRDHLDPMLQDYQASCLPLLTGIFQHASLQSHSVSLTCCFV